MITVQWLAQRLGFGDLLKQLHSFDSQHLAHWQQGEFHHDHLFILKKRPASLRGDYLIVCTNCNAGIKEIISFDQVPERWALWNWRCPENPEFEGQLPTILDIARTVHWFEPCELLKPEARSELKPEFRKRQRGGGWEPI